MRQNGAERSERSGRRGRRWVLGAALSCAAIALCVVACGQIQRGTSGRTPATPSLQSQSEAASGSVRQPKRRAAQGMAEQRAASPEFGRGVLSERLAQPSRREVARLGDRASGAGAMTTAAAGAPGEELWIIPTEVERERAAAAAEERPRAGMRARVPDPGGEDERMVPMPVRETRVSADIDGFLSAVDVSQRYENPFGVKIEAEYVFPLPDDAAVHSFLMRIGERTIRGVIKPREEAERVYEEARSAGYRVSMMTQERANIFTQRVANIMPGESIGVDITYYHTLPYRDDAFEFVLPTTIGPRYNPAGSRDPIVATPVGEGWSAGRGVKTIEYLTPGEDSGHRVFVELDIDARVPIASIASPSHEIAVERRGESGASVLLSSEGGAVADRDFVVRIGVDSSVMRSAFLHTPDEEGGGGFFSLMLVPPELDRVDGVSRRAMEFVFIIDGSGSMSGEPFAHASDAVGEALSMLGRGDTFNLVKFASGAETFRERPVAASSSNIEAASRWLSAFRASGGTEALTGIRAGMSPTVTEDRQRVVVFMTDGMIGNEAEVFGAVREHLNGARVFSFGVGSSPNRLLMNRVAKLGRGAAAYLGPADDAGAVMRSFAERIERPILTGVTLDLGGSEMSSVYPGVGDLEVLAGRPLFITGRYAGEKPSSVRVEGNSGGRAVSIDVPVRAEPGGGSHPALATMWARTRVAHLAESMAVSGDASLAGLIEATALAFDLVSAYTAFVAVDLDEVTPGDHGVSVKQPVRVPQGVKYETTVSPVGENAPGWR